MTGLSEFLEVTVSRQSEGEMRADVRQHRIVIDESAKYGGADRGANPIELILAGLASASLVIIDIVAGRHVTSGVRLHVRAEVNVERIVGTDGEAPSLTKVGLTWEVPPGRDPDEIRALLPELAHRRPGQALLDTAGTAIETVVVLAAGEERGAASTTTQASETNRTEKGTTP